jgi:hypothetical protein
MNAKQDTAYTEITRALQAVNGGRTFRTLGTPEREDLDKTVLLLEELSWEVVSGDIAGFAERMAAAARELRVIADKIDKHYTHLKYIAAVIKKAADAAGIVVGAL